MEKIKLIITLLVLVASCGLTQAQMTGSKIGKGWILGAGARVGFGSMMQKADEGNDRNVGFDGGAEGIFCYYFAQRKSKMPQFGIRTGLSLGYRQNTMSMPVDLTYQALDPQGNSITYHATADAVEETDKLFSVELPVLCAAQYKKISVNLGLRLGFPVLSRYKQTMKNGTLTATYDDFGVEISGEKVTGVLSPDDDKKKAKLDAASFNMCLSLEAGYNLKLFGQQFIVGIYTDYGIVDNFSGGDKHFTDADPGTIDGATSTPTSVVVHSLTDSYVNSVGIFDVGARCVYVIKSKGRGKNVSRPVRNLFK